MKNLSNPIFSLFWIFSNDFILYDYLTYAPTSML